MVNEEYVQNLMAKYGTVHRIVCAANKRDDGVVVCSARHFDSRMCAQMELMGGLEVWSESEQGFIDQWGLFRTREEAWKIAKAAGQIIMIVGSQHTDDEDAELFSENLY